MKIEFTENITLNIVPSELEKLVRGALAEKGYEANNIVFNIQSKTEGYGTDEHETLVFTGVTAFNCKKVE